MTDSIAGQPPKALLAQKLSRANWTLLAIIATLAGAGVLALYSVAGGSFEPYALQQVLRLSIGFICIFATAFIPLRYWYYAAFPFFFASVLLVAVSADFGVAVKGAQRWLEIGPIRLQPSEITKIALVMALAAYYAHLPKYRISSLLWVAIPVVFIAVPSLLVAVQPDLGTSVLIAAGGGIVMFTAGVSYFFFAAVILIAIACITAVFQSRGTEWQLLQDYQYNRIDTFLDPSIDPFGAGYHITQSKIAIGSGGLHGRGFLQGTQSQLNFLPEKHTDFVFTILAEEFGLIFCLVLLSFYAAIIFLCTITAVQSKNRFGSLLALGVGGTLFLNFISNVAMITGLIPVVGVPLPFISYGGSSLLVMMFAFGLVQSVNIHAERY